MEVKKESNNILRSTAIFSVFVFLAQVLGLVRDILLTRFFGISETLDIYYLAFKIPDFLNIFYSVFLGSVVFIPLLTLAKNSHNSSDNKLEVQKIVNSIGTFVLLLVLMATFLLYIFMPYLVQYLAPTWSADKLNTLSGLSRTLLIAQLFFPIGILAGCIGMIYNKPFFMAISGFTYNLFILLGTIFLTKHFGIYGTVYGILVGACVFALIQMYPKVVREYFYGFRFVFRIKEWLNFMKSNIGRFVAVLAYQFFSVLILYIAAFSGTGGVAIFSISFNLFMAAFFILGASLSTALMPETAKLHVTGDKEALRISLNSSILYMFYLSILVILFGVIFSTVGVKTLYYFSSLQKEMEYSIAFIFSLLLLSLPFFNSIEIFRKYFYATNQIRLAGTLTIFMLVLAFLFSKIFMSLNFEVLVALSLSIFLANLLTFLVFVTWLSYRNEFLLLDFLLNIYKSILVTLLSFVVFLFSKGIFYFSNVAEFINITIAILWLIILVLIFTFIFRDNIGKGIILRIIAILSRRMKNSKIG